MKGLLDKEFDETNAKRFCLAREQTSQSKESLKNCENLIHSSKFKVLHQMDDPNESSIIPFESIWIITNTRETRNSWEQIVWIQNVEVANTDYYSKSVIS